MIIAMKFVTCAMMVTLLIVAGCSPNADAPPAETAVEPSTAVDPNASVPDTLSSDDQTADSTQAEPSTESVVDAHIRAIGGVEAIAKIKTIHRTGTISGQSRGGPFSGTVEELFDLSGKRGYISESLTGQSEKYGWMEDSGWVSDTEGGVNDMSAEELKNAQLIIRPISLAAVHATYGAEALSVGGEKEFNGKACIVVTIEGSPIVFCVNQETMLLEGISLPDDVEVTLENYQVIEGVSIPIRAVVKLGAENLTMIYEYKTTDINSEIDPIRFQRPSTQQAAATESVPPAGKLTVEQMISYLDKNGDGKISKDEASDELKPHFAAIDTNGDGSIDSSEAQVLVAYANGQQSESTESVPAAGKPTAEQMISYLDKNGDGKISKDEASDELKPHFAAIDVNGDGSIDSSEAQVMVAYANGQQSESTKSVPAAGKLTVEQIISSMDKNGDGKISKDEASEDAKLFFGDIDTNGDGSIDSSEAQVMVAYANGQQSGSTESVPAAGKPTAEQIISYLDKNGDGKISKEEASDELKPHFAAIDVNGDGSIDSSEAQVMVEYANGQQSGSAKSVPAPEKFTVEQAISFMDKNGDGKISKDEAVDELKPHFAAIDTNGDGTIDSSEVHSMDTNGDGMIDSSEKQAAYGKGQQSGSTESVPAAGKLTVEQIISYLDKNGDGKISKEEASDELKPNFQFIDTNGDGAIDSSEAQVMVAYANASASGTITGAQIISSMDKNGDGKISKDEASDELKPNFQFIDTNGDGAIDSKEAEVMADYANKESGK